MTCPPTNVARVRIIWLSTALGALVGAAVFAVLEATGHVSDGTRVFGWTSYSTPRRYADYLPVGSQHMLAWWLILLLALGAGLVAGALVGCTAKMTGFRVSRRP
jgi:hypothetical protein